MKEELKKKWSEYWIDQFHFSSLDIPGFWIETQRVSTLLSSMKMEYTSLFLCDYIVSQSENLMLFTLLFSKEQKSSVDFVIRFSEEVKHKGDPIKIPTLAHLFFHAEVFEYELGRAFGIDFENRFSLGMWSSPFKEFYLRE